MTRPDIIRADTLDLQNRKAPTAQDHSRQPTNPAPLGIGPAAPHQASAIRQVKDERLEEEEHLQEATQSLRDDPGSDDEGTHIEHEGEQDPRLDDVAARQDGDAEDGDLADAEEADDGLDDDMMDKISSSPSISDGRLPSLQQFLPSSPPKVATPTLESTPFSSPQSSPASDSNSSSPFTSTPLHLPLFAGLGRQHLGSTTRRVISPISYYTTPPLFSSVNISASDSLQSQHHRGKGEYMEEPTGPAVTPSTTNSQMQERDEIVREKEDVLRPLTPIQRPPHFSRRTSRIPRDASLFSLPDINDVLLPEEDSLIFPIAEVPEGTALTDLPGDDGASIASDESWITESECSWEEGGDDHDDASGIFDSLDDRYVDSGWGGECLREVEDIDFEFVYALHTFQATVEGQANATKGDTMVLLDDSNSYWWLVRIVKDSSIGYLPAEHIETPTERLARLNKHRNIDLSATMLSDNAEKSKNPLKKAMRRRNAKTVQFAGPTYVEASDYDWSSEEEEDGEVFGGPEPGSVDITDQDPEDDTARVEPLKIGKKDKGEGTDKGDASEDVEGEDERTSDEIGPKLSRNGTLRNTDSFFKDDSTETRKITLTPNILRDDSSGSTIRSVDEAKRSNSWDVLDREIAGKGKDDKKKKDKKAGMLSGLFKRKEKKRQGSRDEAEQSDSEKGSAEIARDSPTHRSNDSVDKSDAEPDLTPQRQLSKGKLQKAPRGDVSPPKSAMKQPRESPEPVTLKDVAGPTLKSNGQANGQSTMRIVSPEPQDAQKVEARVKSPEEQLQQEEPTRSNSNSRGRSKVSNLFRSGSGDEPRAPKPEKVRKAKQRVELDDFDSSPEPQSNNPFAQARRTTDDSQEQDEPDSETEPEPESTQITERLSDSPMEMSPVDTRQPPGLVPDTASADDVSPVSPLTPQASLSKPYAPSNLAGPPLTAPPSALPPKPPSRAGPTPPASAPSPQIGTPSLSISTTSSSPSLPPWSDSALRAYLDDGSEIKDMLRVIYDTSEVAPVGPADALTSSGLLADERRRVSEMQRELDGMLLQWIGRKQEKWLKRRKDEQQQLQQKKKTVASNEVGVAAPAPAGEVEPVKV